MRNINNSIEEAIKIKKRDLTIEVNGDAKGR